MDQAQQEIMHSLFSLDPSMENRGHLYPYSYPYGQYPYPYPYPYTAPHTPQPHANIPPTTHNIAPSSHPPSQPSHNLAASQANLSPYNSGVHNIRPDSRFHLLADANKQVPDTQHAPEDLRSVHSDSRSQGDTRHHDMRSASSEHRYLNELRSLSNQPRNSVGDSRHLSDYSPQPTDLRTQPIDARLYNNERQQADHKQPQNESRHVSTEIRHHHADPSTVGDPRARMDKSHNDYKYSGSVNPYDPHLQVNPPGIEDTQLSGDPRPPVNNNRPYEDNRSVYGSMNMCANESVVTNPHGQLKPLSHDYYGGRHGIDTTVSADGFSTPVVQDLRMETHPKVHMGHDYVPNPLQNLNETRPQLNIATGHSEAQERNLRYPTISSPNTSLGLLSHALGQHLGQEPDKSNLVNGGGNGTSNNRDCQVKNELQRNCLNDYDEEDDDDFDSEASSCDYPDPYMDFNEVTHGIFNNVNNVAGNGKPFQCEECNATFTTKGNLKVHKRIHTGERPYKCEECGKTFSYCASYQSHKRMHSGERPFKCDSCERAFFRSEHLERHKRRHTGERPYKCTECDATFVQSDGLAKHTRTHTGEKPYDCKDCGMSFAYKSTYRRHRILHDDGRYKCEECETAFHDPDKLEKHLRKHDDPNYVPCSEDTKPKPQKIVENGVEVIGCEFCQSKFNTESHYLVHRKSHTGEKQHICELCGAGFLRRAYLEIHVRTHTGERPFKCDSCKSAFKTLTALNIHKRIHTGDRPFKCEHCNFAFAQQSTLKAHLRIHSGDKPFKCGDCNAAFRQNSSLIIHRRTHTGERPYSCDECGAAFTQRPHLNLHKRSHAGIKPYNCDECHASFTKKDYLIAHKSKHAAGNAIKIEALTEAAGDQVFKCPHCEMVFTHHSSLTVHIRKHTGERPFVCEDCGASFLYSSNLTTHRRKHTGERPYKCDQCESAFILKSYLTMHLRKHSGERPFKCDECDARFTQKTHLSTHRRIHTGECPYKCEECGEAFRDGANFWRHKKKHLIGEGAAPVTKRRARRGRGRGRGRGGVTRETRTVPLRRTTRTRRPVLKFEDLYEQFVLNQDGEPLFLKEEPGDQTIRDDDDDDDDQPYIPINPMVEIKLEGDDENSDSEGNDKENRDGVMEVVEERNGNEGRSHIENNETKEYENTNDDKSENEERKREDDKENLGSIDGGRKGMEGNGCDSEEQEMGHVGMCVQQADPLMRKNSGNGTVNDLQRKNSTMDEQNDSDDGKNTRK